MVLALYFCRQITTKNDKLSIMKIRILCLLVISSVLGGCVPTRKYNEMMLLKDHYKSELDKLQLVQSRMQNLEAELQEKETTLQDTRDQLARLSGRFVQLEDGNRDLVDRYESLRRECEDQVLRFNQQESDLRDSIAFLENALEAGQREMMRLKIEYAGGTEIPDSLLEHISMREQELIAFREQKDSQDLMLSETIDLVSGRLKNWPDTVVGWRLEGEAIRIGMRNDWLFEKNTQDNSVLVLSPQGKRALRRLAELVSPKEGLEIEIRPSSEDFPTTEKSEFAATQAILIHDALVDGGLNAQRIGVRISPSVEMVTPEEEMIGSNRTVIALLPQR